MVKIMPVILEKLVEVMETINPRVKIRKNFACKWLGYFEGTIPDGMTSTEYIKKLRESCYGKTPHIS